MDTMRVIQNAKAALPELISSNATNVRVVQMMTLEAALHGWVIELSEVIDTLAPSKFSGVSNTTAEAQLLLEHFQELELSCTARLDSMKERIARQEAAEIQAHGATLRSLKAARALQAEAIGVARSLPSPTGTDPEDEKETVFIFDEEWKSAFGSYTGSMKVGLDRNSVGTPLQSKTSPAPNADSVEVISPDQDGWGFADLEGDLGNADGSKANASSMPRSSLPQLATIAPGLLQRTLSSAAPAVDATELLQLCETYVSRVLREQNNRATEEATASSPWALGGRDTPSAVAFGTEGRVRGIVIDTSLGGRSSDDGQNDPPGGKLVATRKRVVSGTKVAPPLVRPPLASQSNFASLGSDLAGLRSMSPSPSHAQSSHPQLEFPVPYLYSRPLSKQQRARHGQAHLIRPASLTHNLSDASTGFFPANAMATSTAVQKGTLDGAAATSTTQLQHSSVARPAAVNTDDRDHLFSSSRSGSAVSDAADDAAADTIAAELLELIAEMKERSLNLQSRLQNDNASLDSTAASVETNIDSTVVVNERIAQQYRVVLGSMCGTLGLLAFSVVVFVGAYAVIRFAPSPPPWESSLLVLTYRALFYTAACIIDFEASTMRPALKYLFFTLINLSPWWSQAVETDIDPLGGGFDTFDDADDSFTEF